MTEERKTGWIEMGHSDSIIFPRYEAMLRKHGLMSIQHDDVCFLSQPRSNRLTTAIKSKRQWLYDLQPDSPDIVCTWDMNGDWHELNARQFDLIIMTRASCFADSSQALVDNILKHLRPGGHALVDWTIGAHYDDQKCIKSMVNINDVITLKKPFIDFELFQHNAERGQQLYVITLMQKGNKE